MTQKFKATGQGGVRSSQLGSEPVNFALFHVTPNQYGLLNSAYGVGSSLLEAWE